MEWRVKREILKKRGWGGGGGGGKEGGSCRRGEWGRGAGEWGGRRDLASFSLYRGERRRSGRRDWKGREALRRRSGVEYGGAGGEDPVADWSRGAVADCRDTACPGAMERGEASSARVM